MATGVRDKITLACNECKRRNYMSTKSKRNTPDRLEVRKYCRWCGRSHRSPGDALDGTPDACAAACPPGADDPGSEAALPGGPPAPPPQAHCPCRGSSRAGARAEGARGGGVRGFIGESWAELKKVEWPTQSAADPGRRRRPDRLRDRRHLPLHVRPRLQAPRPGRVHLNVQLVRHQHVLGPREQGEDQSRAPDHVHEPGAEVPPGRRPDRAGDRDEGGPEGPDREARAPGLRPRQHGHDRRGLDGREEHARASPASSAPARSPSRSPSPRSTGSSTPAAATANARAPRSSSRSASP